MGRNTLVIAGLAIRALVTAIAVIAGGALATAQTPPQNKPVLSEKAFKNVKVLTGLPVDQFMATMGFFSASLGENCTFCHLLESGGSWEKYADDNEQKRTARRMIVMVAGINKSYFGGRRVVTCYSCHRAGDRPLKTPSLTELYGPPAPPREPDDIVSTGPKDASVEQVFDRFIQALGGPDKLAKLTSFAAKGTSQNYPETQKYSVEVYAQAPGRRVIIVHSPNGDTTTAYDGRAGWLAGPTAERPLPLIELTGGELDGAKLEAALSFPGQIKQSLSQLRVGYPAEIDDREVRLVQGTSDGRNPVNLYFDSKSDLLVRVVRYTESPVGLNPTQIDYSDYREVVGVKMPFRWAVSWLDGRVTIELSDVQPNVQIDEARCAKPTR